MITNIAELVAFLKQWHRFRFPDAAKWSLAEAAIPDDLPPGLATIYREFGQLVDDDDEYPPFGTQDHLTPLAHVKRVDGMISFACENQGNFTVRCPLGAADPPVFSDAADVWNEPARGFVQVGDSLNAFLITLCLQEAAMSSPVLASVDADPPYDQAFTIPLIPLWLNGLYVDSEPDHHFYVSPERDVLVMDWNGLWVGSLQRPVQQLVNPSVPVRQLR